MVGALPHVVTHTNLRKQLVVFALLYGSHDGQYKRSWVSAHAIPCVHTWKGLAKANKEIYGSKTCIIDRQSP